MVAACFVLPAFLLFHSLAASSALSSCCSHLFGVHIILCLSEALVGILHLVFTPTLFLGGVLLQLELLDETNRTAFKKALWDSITSKPVFSPYCKLKRLPLKT